MKKIDRIPKKHVHCVEGCNESDTVAQTNNRLGPKVVHKRGQERAKQPRFKVVWMLHWWPPEPTEGDEAP